MKFVKYVFFFFIVIISVALIAALFIKKSYSVERSIVINQPRSKVFKFIKYLKNQDKFSYWAMEDPGMKKDYKGEDGKLGFVASWDSDNKKVGKGEQEIKGIKENERVDYEIRFFEPFEATDYAYLITEEAPENSTLVTWGFHGKFDYPKNLVNGFLNMDKMLGNQLNEGLDNLKSLMEEKH